MSAAESENEFSDIEIGGYLIPRMIGEVPNNFDSLDTTQRWQLLSTIFFPFTYKIAYHGYMGCSHRLHEEASRLLAHIVRVGPSVERKLYLASLLVP